MDACSFAFYFYLFLLRMFNQECVPSLSDVLLEFVAVVVVAVAIDCVAVACDVGYFFSFIPFCVFF